MTILKIIALCLLLALCGCLPDNPGWGVPHDGQTQDIEDLDPEELLKD